VAVFTTQVKVKRALGIPAGVTMHDDFIDDLLEVADEEITAWTGQVSLALTTVTDEAYDVTNDSTSGFTLRNFPVSSVAAVKSGGDTLSTDSWYLEARSGTIRLTDASSYFESGRQELKVSYSYGFDPASIPADISHAATIVCVSHFNRTRHAGFTGEGLGSYRYSMDRFAMPAGARALLAKYRRIFPKGSQPT
jgi:hypothetical protein